MRSTLDLVGRRVFARPWRGRVAMSCRVCRVSAACSMAVILLCPKRLREPKTIDFSLRNCGGTFLGARRVFELSWDFPQKPSLALVEH